MSQVFSINDPPGAFRVFASDGGTAFDSRYETHRVHMTGVVELAGRTTSPGPGGSVILNPSAGVSVPYGKTFATPPYLVSASRKTQVNQTYLRFTGQWIVDDQPLFDQITRPFIYYAPAADFYTYLRGHFTNAGVSSVFLGNVNATGSTAYSNADVYYNGARRVWYAVLDNPAGA